MNRIKALIFSVALMTTLPFTPYCTENPIKGTITTSAADILNAEQLPLIPKPFQLQLNKGNFAYSAEISLFYSGGLAETAKLAVGQLGLKGDINAGKSGSNAIHLKLDKRLHTEEYKLDVDPNGIHVSGGSPIGVFYGIQTLSQLIDTNVNLQNIPCLSIRDWPRFAWRGLMLDCSRTFQSIRYLKKTIDLLSLYKMNVLHLHLTDDQGWRMEIKSHPELTEKGAKFSVKYSEPADHQGFYTQEELKDLVRYASLRGITIVPEIEMPGHSFEVVVCHPELSCTRQIPDGIYPFFKGLNITKDILCAGNDQTFVFLQDILDEVVDVFPSKYIHIGGDEAPKDRWKGCTKCQERIKKEGLKDEKELQSYFIHRIEKYINAKGRRLLGWSEILEGGLAPNAVVMDWIGGASQATEEGHDVVMSPTSHCYFDYTYNKISSERAYSYDPVAGLSLEQAKHVLGLQANFWSHIDREPQQVDKQLYPRLLSVAERGWSPASFKEWPEFKNRLNAHLPRLKHMGVNYYSEPSETVTLPAKPEKSQVKEIIVICKTHFDIGYTHRVKDIVQYYRTSMIDNALKIMEASKEMPKEQQFVWTAPGWVMSKLLEDWPGQTPERRQKLDQAFKSGKFLTHAMPFTIESDACEPEEMARGLGFASQLARKYNLPLPGSCKVTDVPSHTGALATVLANGGVKFIHIGCNWPSGFVKTPGLFWWEGPDGSRVLTLYSSIYGTCYGLYPKEWTSPNDPMVGENLIPAKNWPYKVWPAILVTPDNSGPPKAEQVKAMFDEVAKKLPEVKVRMGIMDDFVTAILAEKPELPVIKGEMPDTWIHGVMCDPGGIRLSREVHPLLASAEALNTQLHWWGVKTPSISKSVALAYEKILLYGEHTWGGAQSVNDYGEAFKKLPPQKYADLEASWEDKTDYIRDASRLTHAISDSNMITLARSVKHDAPCIVVYNPLPWKRSGIVEVNGKHFNAINVPPCGYRSYPLKTTEAFVTPISSRSIENEFFKIVFDPAKGSIVSLVEKRIGREWVDQSAEQGLGQYLNERFTYEQTLKYTLAYEQGRALNSFGTKGDWPHPGMYKPGMPSEKEVPYRAACSGRGTLKIAGDPESQTAILEMPGDTVKHMAASILRVTLFKGQPCIDLEITIKEKAKDNWPEADWLCLPFRIDNPQFSVFRPLGVMNPAIDIVPGANRHLYSVGFGVTITDTNGSGIAVCPIDHPLVSLDTPGCWKFSLDFVPKRPKVYVNLYNNQWNTNFRYWYPGTWSSRVRILTFDKNTAMDAVIASPALEARNPLQAVVTEGKGGLLPSEQTGLTVSRKGVVVTAFGTDPDGNEGTLLRVWEQAGVSGDLTVTLPGGVKVKTFIPVNLRGEITGEPMMIKNSRISFFLKNYSPASFILK